MSEYVPDAWEIIEITYEEEVLHKVIGGWYGGYTGSDFWKISSGITKIEEEHNKYIITNHSGSVYICYKGTQGFTGLSRSVYENYKQQCDEKSIPFSLAEINTIKEQYK